MSLASKLPYDHPYAGGYPGIGSQPLPTDADAIDYLTRMATADGAGVEVGVATALDAFFRDTKAAGVFDALKACCILCGARTITGALVPLAGDAPTAQGGWSSGDYDRSAGLTGDGNALYLDSNRAGDAEDQDDIHLAVYLVTAGSLGPTIAGHGASGTAGAVNFGNGSFQAFARCRTAADYRTASTGYTGLMGVSREGSSGYAFRYDGSTDPVTEESDGVLSDSTFIFARNIGGTPLGVTDATIAFYSIGTSLSLEDLDTAVTNLITAIGEAL